MEPIVRKAVFPVAGMGTRFLPATKAMAKEMLPVVDKPIIQYAVEEAVAAGIEQIIFVTGRHKRSIEDHFDYQEGLEALLVEQGKEELARIYREVSDMAEVSYVRQKTPLGLGHAINCARHFVGDEPFAVLLPDDLLDCDEPAIGQMKAAFEASGASQLGVEPVAPEEVHRYGIIYPAAEEGRSYPLCGVVEKPARQDAPSQLGVMGRYILSPKVFEYLARGERGAGGEIQLTDAVQALIDEAGEPVHGYRVDGVRYDCGNKLGYLQAQVDFGLRHGELGEDFAAFLRSRSC